MPIDAHKLEKEFTFEGHGTASELLNGLGLAGPLEAKINGRPKLIRWSALGALIFFIALGVATGVALLFLVGIVAAIGLLIRSLFVQPIQKDRIEFLRLLLTTLSHDAGSRGRLHVKLQLRVQRETLSEGPIPGQKSGKQTLLQDSWFTLSGHLADGTSLDYSILDITRQRTKKNARNKTKTKERIKSILRIRLTYNPAIYGDVSLAMTRVKNPFRLPKGTIVRGVFPGDKNLGIKALIEGDRSPAGIHSSSEAILLGAYRVLNLARRRAATTTGGTK